MTQFLTRQYKSIITFLHSCLMFFTNLLWKNIQQQQQYVYSFCKFPTVLWKWKFHIVLWRLFCLLMFHMKNIYFISYFSFFLFFLSFPRCFLFLSVLLLLFCCFKKSYFFFWFNLNIIVLGYEWEWKYTHKNT